MPSTVIRRFSYDAQRRQLTIVFQTGRSYVYENVPPETYAALKSAPSRGEYFNEHIRDHFPFTRGIG